jgi:hypothetical protein
VIVEQLRQAVPPPEKSSRLPGIVLLQLFHTTLMLRDSITFVCIGDKPRYTRRR